ncbi:hypothetical protein [Anaerobiospirillum thomasii]|uniref:Acetyltransferase (Isoleucine patch superfamily) n=1 Tax=Anaerobiospirillum thomasii TaxID=179995 RepID=A0A2X0VD60_9GAMM|nr:hypothetical protein [Anaerobiospirillum thomasii]SPT70845.1 Acetyltransferase (isoleucine patch superfamily) [Anaerobiospirillum thomasii]SPT78795.1 Acetyltransferase (isoleucine patch superfamily) [Anaerobiospirillum thomasii]
MIFDMKNNNFIYLLSSNCLDYLDNQTISNHSTIFDSLSLSGCNLTFSGKNNILIITGKTKFKSAKIVFHGNNSIVIIGDSLVSNTFIHIYNNSNLFIGHKNYFNLSGTPKMIIIGECQNVLIGNDCLFSVSLWIGNTSGHPIYDLNGHRIDEQGVVFIGVHVWFSETISILGPAIIASGAIIGANSFIHNKTINSNTLWAGELCKQIASNRCWIRETTASYSIADTDNSKCKEVHSVIFKHSSDSILPTQIDYILKNQHMMRD